MKVKYILSTSIIFLIFTDLLAIDWKQRNAQYLDSLAIEISKHPNNPENYYKRAKMALLFGGIDDVQIDQDLRFAISLADSAKYYVLRAQTHLIKKRYKKCIEDAEFAINLGDSSVKCYRYLGEGLLNLANFEKSILYFDKGIEIAKKKLNQKNKEELSIKERVHRTIEYELELAHALAGKGRSLYNLQRYEEAIVNFELIEQFNAKYYNEESFLDWSLCNFYMKKYFKCMELANKVIEADSISSSAYAIKARAKNALSDYRGSIADLTIAIKNTEEVNKEFLGSLYYMRARNTIALYTKSNGVDFIIPKYKEAILDFDQALLLYKHAEYFYYRGVTKMNLRMVQEGCLDLSKAGELGYEEAYTVIKKFCNN